MNRLLYRLMYNISQPRWDTGQTPPEVIEALENLQPGQAIDLGCGTGTNVIYMAQRGWQVIGLDFVPEAIEQALQKASQAGMYGQANFRVADVTRLASLSLPMCDFALDMGCFHGLSDAGRQAYVKGLAQIMKTGGQYMLYAFMPRRILGRTYGLTPDEVRATFTPEFEVVRSEKGGFWDGNVFWYWMVRI